MQKSFNRIIELDMKLENQTMIAYTIQNKGLENHGFETFLFPGMHKKFFKMSFKAVPECLKQIGQSICVSSIQGLELFDIISGSPLQNFELNRSFTNLFCIDPNMEGAFIGYSYKNFYKISLGEKVDCEKLFYSNELECITQDGNQIRYSKRTYDEKIHMFSYKLF